MQKLLHYRVAIIAAVVLAKILWVSVEATLANVLFYLERVLAIERVTLRHQIVEAAAKGPDVDFGIQEIVGTIFKNFRRGIVKMPAKALILE